MAFQLLRMLRVALFLVLAVVVLPPARGDNASPESTTLEVVGAQDTTQKIQLKAKLKIPDDGELSLPIHVEPLPIAIWGDGFCEASCRALTVLLNSLELVVVFNGIAYLIALVAKVIVCCCIGIASYYYFEYVQGGKQDDELGSAEFATMYSAVTFLCMCLGYLIADAFTDTYEMTGDTVLICFLEDIKHNYQQGRKMTGPDQVLKGVLNAHVKKAEIHTSNA